MFFQNLIMHLFFANVYIILCVSSFLDKLLPDFFFPSKLVHVNLCVAPVAQSCVCAVLENLVPNLSFLSKLSHVNLCSSCNIIMCMRISREAFAWSFFGQSFSHVSFACYFYSTSTCACISGEGLSGLFFVKPFVREFVCSACSTIELDF